MSATVKMNSQKKIAVIKGDGIGKEVVPEGIRVLEAVIERYGYNVDWDYFDWGCDYFLEHGCMMPANGLERLRQYDAIYLGAVGLPNVVPDHVSLGGLLLPIRKHFQQYANIRPVRLMPGVPCPLAHKNINDIDFIVVRENTEGEYSSVGGIIGEGTEDEVALQVSSFSKKGVDRIFRYAFKLAAGRPAKHLTSATKSNGLNITMPYWDDRFRKMAALYPDINVDQYHIDILTAQFVLHPEKFDVVVASNLFGDILSDLGPACSGTIGIAPSANLNPEGCFPSMFEPVHGSAPDIAGKGIANPIAQIWSGALMLEHLNFKEAAKTIVRAIEHVLVAGPRTPDLKGKAATEEVGRRIAEAARVL